MALRSLQRDVEARQAVGSARTPTRDEVLTAALIDRLAYDRRTEHLELGVRVHREVAHVRGQVASEAERQLVRGMLRDMAGLHAVWDMLTLPGEQLATLDIGCGGTKQMDGAIGLDMAPVPGVDVVADLEAGLPFADDSIDHIFAVHVIEHVQDLLGLMDECHRVLRPTGVMHVMAPHWRSVNAIADPTHCRLIDVQTLKYWCRPERIQRWRVLRAHTSHDNVFGDLQPLPRGAPPDLEALARWFD